MASGRVAVHHDAAREPAPQEQARLSHLVDDAGDRDVRAEIVAGDRDRHAVAVEPLRHVAELAGLERAPVAAMDEQRERRVAAALRVEQVDGLARRRPIGEAEIGPSRGLGGLAIGGRVALPAREDLRMLGDARAIVVFGLIVGRHVVPRVERKP
jgi:hypothetical protein